MQIVLSILLLKLKPFKEPVSLVLPVSTAESIRNCLGSLNLMIKFSVEKPLNLERMQMMLH